jgi:hypothetical protein
MNFVRAMDKMRWSLLLAACLLVGGCVSLILSPRQQVVMSALESMCKTKDVQALSPFVTDDLQLLLEVSGPLVNVLESSGIFRVSDEIAAACQDRSVKFGDEIKVTDDRYLVRLSSKEKKVAYQFIVVKERVDWKISSVKK